MPYSRDYYIANKARIIEQQKTYNDSRKEKLKEYKRRYYIANKEKHINTAKEWVDKNRDKSRKIKAAWIANNPEKNKESQRKYFENNKDKFRSNVRNRRARLAELPGDGISIKQEKQLKEEYNYRCAYCGKKKPLALDHVVPISRGGMHDISNVVPACKSCNSKKNARTLLMWMYIKQNEDY